MDELFAGARREAYEVLSMRFPNVTQEEIDNVTAHDIQTLLRYESDCRFCPKDVAKCPHYPHGYTYAPCENDELIRAAYGRRFSIALEKCALLEEAGREMREISEETKSLIPYQCKSNTFAEFKTFNIPILQAAKGMARDCLESGKSIIFGGGVGCGKTHLAIAIGLEALKQGSTVRFYVVPELLERIRQDMLAGQSSIIEDVKACDVLILDDLGTESLTGWKSEQLFVLIDSRYKTKRQTVITTNAATESALKKLMSSGGHSERIISRISGMCETVFMTGISDYRQRKTKTGG